MLEDRGVQAATRAGALAGPARRLDALGCTTGGGRRHRDLEERGALGVQRELGQDRGDRGTAVSSPASRPRERCRQELDAAEGLPTARRERHRPSTDLAAAAQAAPGPDSAPWCSTMSTTMRVSGPAPGGRGPCRCASRRAPRPGAPATRRPVGAGVLEGGSGHRARAGTISLNRWSHQAPSTPRSASRLRARGARSSARSGPHGAPPPPPGAGEDVRGRGGDRVPVVGVR